MSANRRRGSNTSRGRGSRGSAGGVAAATAEYGADKGARMFAITIYGIDISLVVSWGHKSSLSYLPRDSQKRCSRARTVQRSYEIYNRVDSACFSLVIRGSLTHSIEIKSEND